MRASINRYHLVLSPIILILLSASIIYENPHSSRKIVLISLSVIYFVIAFMRFEFKRESYKVGLMIVIVGLFIGIEFNSKYAINYFYQSLYYLEMIYCVFYLIRRNTMFMGGMLVFGSTVKFINLVLLEPNVANISISLFFFVINILMLVVIFLAKTYQEENRKTKALYKELLEVYRQLKDYSRDVKVLASYEERTRIARDLHDTLGHELTGLIMQLEITSSLFDGGNGEGGIKLLEESKQSAREALTKVREIVNTLKQDQNTWTNESIIELMQRFSDKTNIEIITDINVNEEVTPDVGITLYRTVQESLTNALRHGKATIIEVSIQYEENFIKVMIKDNGIGCDDIKMGNGLKGMKSRIESLRGTLRIINNEGFTVICKIPNNIK